MGYEIINYKAIAASALVAGKSFIYRMSPQRPGGNNVGDTVGRQTVTTDGYIGTHPDDALGRSFITDLGIGTNEGANDIILRDAVCNVSRSTNVVKTSLVGLAGTIKEYITPGDYDISISIGLECTEGGNIIDRYPSDAVVQLRTLLEKPQALYVSSDFLRLFDITRIVVESYAINNTEFQNYQGVDIRACSDEDFTIKCNEY